jgi:hypothetical protein
MKLFLADLSAPGECVEISTGRPSSWFFCSYPCLSRLGKKCQTCCFAGPESFKGEKIHFVSTTFTFGSYSVKMYQSMEKALAFFFGIPGNGGLLFKG